MLQQCGHSQTAASPEQRTYLPWALVPGSFLFTTADLEHLTVRNVRTTILTFDFLSFSPIFSSLEPNKPKYVISKMCSPTCPAASQQQNQASQRVSCCEKPLCNVNGVSSKRSSYGVMSLGVLAGITYIFVCGL